MGDEATRVDHKAVPEVKTLKNSVAAEVGTCCPGHSVQVGDREGEDPVRHIAVALLLGSHRDEGNLQDQAHDLGSVCCNGEGVWREGGRCSTAAAGVAPGGRWWGGGQGSLQ